MNNKDRLLQKQLPTIMVPKYDDPSPLETGHSRFLMTESGLWIESKTQWGEFTRQLYQSPRTLPYGMVQERTELSSGAIPREMVAQFREEADQHAEEGHETAAWVIWDLEKGWTYLHLEKIHQSSSAVQFTWPRLSPEQHLVLDMHSHGKGKAFFSHTDNHSDQGQVHFSLVLGCCGKQSSSHQYALRLCLSGFFFEYPSHVRLWKE